MSATFATAICESAHDGATCALVWKLGVPNEIDKKRVPYQDFVSVFFSFVRVALYVY
jgi:hypothetical protein